MYVCMYGIQANVCVCVCVYVKCKFILIEQQIHSYLSQVGDVDMPSILPAIDFVAPSGDLRYPHCEKRTNVFTSILCISWKNGPSSRKLHPIFFLLLSSIRSRESSQMLVGKCTKAVDWAKLFQETFTSDPSANTSFASRLSLL
jgi:hypothetical protein